MDPSLDLVEYFKLTTEFLPEVTQHTSYKSARSQGVRRVKVVKRWSRREDLGEGSFSTVWLEVEDDGSKRAVKAISRKMCSSHNIDYKKEVAAMAKLSRHDHLFVELFGWFENTENIYLAMEYFKHGDLQQYIAEKIPEGQVKTIMVQLLQGLEIMHQKGFTHRDLKPQNIFVVEKGPVWWVKIGDFGITKRITNEDTFLKTEIGTRDYLAPEVIGYVEEETPLYTNAVDIWSLGCICHRLLTLQLPFAKLRALAPYCLGKSQLPIESMDKDTVSAEAINFVKGTMAAQPAERWNTFSALQSFWLKDVADEEMSLGTLTSTVSRNVARPSPRLNHGTSLDGVHDTSIHSKENQRPRKVEPLIRGDRADPEGSTAKHVSKTRVDPPNEKERHSLDTDSTTRVQRKPLTHLGRKPKITINDVFNDHDVELNEEAMLKANKIPGVSKDINGVGWDRKAKDSATKKHYDSAKRRGERRDQVEANGQGRVKREDQAEAREAAERGSVTKVVAHPIPRSGRS